MKNKTSKTKRQSLREETIQGILGIVFLVAALFFMLASFGKAGLGGEKIYSLGNNFLGFGYYVVPTLFLVLAISSFKKFDGPFSKIKIFGSLLFFLSALGFVSLVGDAGGVVGSFIALPLLKLFDKSVSIIFFFAALIISILMILDIRISLRPLLFWRRNTEEDGVSLADTETEENPPKESFGGKSGEKNLALTQKPSEKAPKIEGIITDSPKDIEPGFILERHLPPSLKEFVPIPLSLLEGDRGKPGVGDIKANANIIKRTLQNFGIEVEMDEVSIGPSVTRYALKPAEGVKLSRIVALQNDLSLALAAHPIRIEAPIPGKSLVGIEIPNSVKTTVGLASLLSASEFQQSEKPLLVGLGKGVSGRSFFGNLAKMPHLLIAGATGSGKSVTIHSLITSLLYRNSPENLRFIMIDPKRVELTLYNKIPHLLTPVITEAKKTILALKWAAKEMDRRYDILETESVRDIESYHKNILAPVLKRISAKGKTGDGENDGKLPEIMPYIVIIVDELADIMATYPRELEAAVVRLAQMSRAVGIHLILSTQRPSVNVITGLIKANVPARIALQVASQIDSRTILDAGGAEKLLGAGDMLYLSGDMSQPQRVQSAFISETEVKNVVKFLKDAYREELGSEILLSENHDKNVIFDSTLETSGGLEEDDDMYEQARDEVLKAGKASTSYLQRRLRVGYARAARLIDLLEERGVIGVGEGAKPREVFGTATPSEVPEETPPANPN